jgi:DNA-binding GntR family transcriptional regulator
MDQQAVREHAQAHCDALLAGDVERAAAELSEELRSNIGPLLAQLPVP